MPGPEVPGVSPGRRDGARAVTKALEGYVAADAEECHRSVEPSPGTRRPLRGLTHLFR
jgi:hypothetical protein